jgi:hypothetical protein
MARDRPVMGPIVPEGFTMDEQPTKSERPQPPIAEVLQRARGGNDRAKLDLFERLIAWCSEHDARIAALEGDGK